MKKEAAQGQKEAAQGQKEAAQGQKEAPHGRGAAWLDFEDEIVTGWLSL